MLCSAVKCSPLQFVIIPPPTVCLADKLLNIPLYSIVEILYLRMLFICVFFFALMIMYLILLLPSFVQYKKPKLLFWVLQFFVLFDLITRTTFAGPVSFVILHSSHALLTGTEVCYVVISDL